MPVMPGEIVVDGPWDPIDETFKTRENTRNPYKPELAAPPPGGAEPGNPFAEFVGEKELPAQQVTNAPVSLWERFKGNFIEQQNYGSKGINELTEIQDAENGYIRGQFVGKEAAAPHAELIRQRRMERQAEYQRMPGSETTAEYLAAIGGGLAGGIADPISLLGPEIKVGTVGWQTAHPIISKMLNYSVSGAAANAGLNVIVQAEEMGADIRPDWDFDLESIAIDAGAGALFGAVTGGVAGHSDAQAQDFAREYLKTEMEKAADEATIKAAFENAPEPGKTPMAPRKKGKGTQAEDAAIWPPRPTTNDSITEEHGPRDIADAQEALFGEVIGTRNMTTEQLDRVDDYLNAKKNGDVPQGPTETQGGLKNERAAPAPENVPVRGEAPPAGEPVRQVQLQEQQEVRKAAPLPIGRNYADFSPSELKVDAKRFQFKEGGDEAGATDRLKGVKEWDQTKAGITLVWEDLAGNHYVADGHQRVALAKRLEAEGQSPKIHALILKESEGYSPEKVRAIAAAANIAQGTGTAIDAAKILRAAPDAAKNLPPNSALVRDAQGLAKLSDDGFGMVINKVVPPGYAAHVGRLAPDPKSHAQILSILRENAPENTVEAESIVRDAIAAPMVQEIQNDMFGSAVETQVLFKERAQIVSSAATAIRKDRAAFNMLVKEEGRLTKGGNKLATKTNAERAEQDAKVLAVLQAEARRKGPIADALAEAAAELRIAPGARQAIVGNFLESLRGRAAIGRDDRSSNRPVGRPPETDQIAASLGGYRNTDQPAFKKWYGNSTLVEPDGKPIVVYHQTDKPFQKVDMKKGAQQVFWVTNNKAAIDAGEIGATGGGHVMELYAKIERPAGWELYDKLSLGEIAARGYDGVVLPNKDGTFDAIVFEPNQIKSVYNRGTFDPGDDRIAFSVRQPGPSLFDVEPGAEGKPQMVIPGAEKAPQAQMLQRRADATLRAKAPQKALDIGLFGDGHTQLDLVDLAKVAPMVRADSDYLNLAPGGGVRSLAIGPANINYSVRDGEVEIHAVRVPIAERGQGAARAALIAFLEKTDAANLRVKTFAIPLDKTTDREGIIRLYEGLGFTATGRKVNRHGDIEMVRREPPPEMQNLRRLVGSGRLVPLRDYTDPGMAQEVKRAYYGAQPERDLDELYSGPVQRNQQLLSNELSRIADELGIEFHNPGPKDKDKAAEKILRKGYTGLNQLTDLVRGGLRVDTPEQAQRAVHMLAEKFMVLDEGWNLTPNYYFDRKLGVTMPDGTVAEVQFWQPDLIDAKMAQGYALYEEWRSLPLDDPRSAELMQAQIDLYRPIYEGLDPSWGATVGRGGRSQDANVAASSASSSRSRPESATSAPETGIQSPPGSKTAQARPASMTAGRDSQSTKRNMDPLLQPGGEWRKAEVEGILEDGSTVKLPAGEAIDFLSKRRKSLAELLACVNAA